MLWALIVLVFVNIIYSTLNFDFLHNKFGAFLPKIIMCCIGGVIVWYIAGGFFELLAYAFNKSGKLKQLMCCFAYSLFPIALFAPIQAIKPIGETGYFLGVLLEAILYFWSLYLMAKSIEITYELTFQKAVIIILLPIISAFVSTFWLIEFISKIIYIFKI